MIVELAAHASQQVVLRGQEVFGAFLSFGFEGSCEHGFPSPNYIRESEKNKRREIREKIEREERAKRQYIYIDIIYIYIYI